MKPVITSLKSLHFQVASLREKRSYAVANITEVIEGWLEVMESKRPLAPSRMVKVVV